MNFIEAITFYKNGKIIKRRGDSLSLKPSYYLQKKLKKLRLNEREQEHLRLSTIMITEGDILANDWVIVEEKV
jgi:hypothetical protein